MLAVTTTFQPIPVDTRRNDRYQPGQLIHSVNINQSDLECLYCWKTCPFCCCNERLAKASYMDIYSNGVEIGKPKFCCYGACCCASDTSVGGFHHYDDNIVFGDSATTAECCSPCPFCCVNNCGCCGEAVVMKGSCCAGESLFSHANQYAQWTWCPVVSCCCCPLSVMYGLSAGEANRAASIINTAKQAYKAGNWPKEARVAMTMNPTLANPMASGVAVMAAAPPMGQPIPSYADAPQYTPNNKDV